jgi:hypothetical protein
MAGVADLGQVPGPLPVSYVLRRRQAQRSVPACYAGQGERDHAALADAVTSGRMQAQMGI